MYDLNLVGWLKMSVILSLFFTGLMAVTQPFNFIMVPLSVLAGMVFSFTVYLKEVREYETTFKKTN